MMPVTHSICPDHSFAREVGRRQGHHGRRVGFTTLSRLRQIAFTKDRLLSAILAWHAGCKSVVGKTKRVPAMISAIPSRPSAMRHGLSDPVEPNDAL